MQIMVNFTVIGIKIPKPTGLEKFMHFHTADIEDLIGSNISGLRWVTLKGNARQL